LPSAREGLRESTLQLNNPSPQERADQTQDLAILDALGHQVHQDVMVDVVEGLLGTLRTSMRLR
jgi:hypothetical protein